MTGPALGLGIDVGATGIKGAIVDLHSGLLVSDRIKIKTPESGLPNEMIDVIKELLIQLEWKGSSIGVGFPSIVKNGKCLSANNIDDSWIGLQIDSLIKEATGLETFVLNDADAAGIAEMNFGHGIDKKGTIIILTLGTGIGSSIFKDGHLLPNIELGSLWYKENIAEFYVSNSARKREEMEWEHYGTALNEYIKYVDRILAPDHIIIGGGISKKFKNYGDQFDGSIEVVPAALKNNAGIIGAALYQSYSG